MKNFSPGKERRWWQIVALVSLMLLASSSLFAQGAGTPKLTLEQFAGKYKGAAKSPARDLALTLEIKVDSGKMSGLLTESANEHRITGGEISGNKLVLTLLGKSGPERLTLETRDGKLTGEWVIASGEWTATGGKPGPIQFEAMTDPAKADILTGEWEAVADAGGQPFPFTLSLKRDGDKVTGSSESQLGTSSISAGSFKDGKLELALEAGAGQIVLTASMVDGKLSGDYDFAGQSSGKWVAIKKK